MAANHSTLEKDTLRTHIQSLPLELHDVILEFTLTTPSNQTIHINSSYSPPLSLQINRSYRNHAANKYYTTNIFEISTSSCVLPWLKSLPSAHTLKIKDLRIAMFDEIEARLRSRAPRMMLRPILLRGIYDISHSIARARIHLARNAILKTDWKAPGTETVKVWFGMSDFAAKKDPRSGWDEAGWDGKMEERPGENMSKRAYVDFRLKVQNLGLDRSLEF